MKSLLPIFAALLLAAAVGAEQRLPPYPKPPFLSITMPRSGFAAADSNDDRTVCDSIADLSWVRNKGRNFSLFVNADGPSGSGRFWNVTYGMASARAAIPHRGFCITVSTIGWRTLQSFHDKPRPWVEDRDRDGTPELIVWESFGLSDSISLVNNGVESHWGLTGWVYRVKSSGRCAIDYPLSRTLAKEIAALYRQPYPGADSSLTNQRNRAASILEAFARLKNSSASRQ
jgi:hypothetical protein